MGKFNAKLVLLLLLAAHTCQVWASCNTDSVKNKFQAGDWKASYGKRLWDSQSVVSIVGFFFPATAPAAAAALEKFINEQLAGAERALAEAAASARTDATQLLMGTVSSLLSGNLTPADLRLPTLDLKVNIVRVNCQQCASLPCPTLSKPTRTCKNCVNSEGYYQLAVGYRLKGRVGGSSNTRPTESGGSAPSKTCAHNCARCGQSGLFGGCKKCCW